MTSLLAGLHARFDHVVVDSPPIALYPDGLAIASKVDGVLLVVKASTTPLDAVRDSKRLLERVGAKVCGVVLNRMDPLSGKYYGYSGTYESAGTSASPRPRLDGWASRS
jgi:Mrp family chromosome partitioning ATPase